MGNFNKGNKFGGGKDDKRFGGGRNSGGDRGQNRDFSGGRDHQKMHKAVCTECGKSCEVPFRPTSGKPIYCNDCFRDKRDDGPQNFRDRGRDNRNSSRRYSRPPQPRFNDRPFKSDRDKHVPTENYKIQLEQLNDKLDKILKVITLAVEKEVKTIETPVPNKVKEGLKKEVDQKQAIKKTAVKKKNKKSVSKRK